MFARSASWGHDPWINPDTIRPADMVDAPADPLEHGLAHFATVPDPPVTLFATLLGAGAARVPALFAGQDTIGGDIGLLAPGLSGYGSYVDNFGGFSQLSARFPQGRQAVGLPWGYTSASNMGALTAIAAHRPFVRFSAHYGHGPHICSPQTCGFAQADVTQWDDHGARGENVDRWLGFAYAIPGCNVDHPLLLSITILNNRAQCADVEPGAMAALEFPDWYDHRALSGPTPPAPPPPPRPEDIVDIAAAELNGIPHVFVTDKNGDVFYTYQGRDEHGHVGTAWNGGKQGVSPAGLVFFAPAPK